VIDADGDKKSDGGSLGVADSAKSEAVSKASIHALRRFTDFLA